MLGKEKNLISRVALLYYFKCPVFNKKTMRQAKRQQSMTHTQEKKKTNRNWS